MYCTFYLCCLYFSNPNNPNPSKPCHNKPGHVDANIVKHNDIIWLIWLFHCLIFAHIVILSSVALYPMTLKPHLLHLETEPSFIYNDENVGSFLGFSEKMFRKYEEYHKPYARTCWQVYFCAKKVKFIHPSIHFLYPLNPI